jgi:hypothetical protein
MNELQIFILGVFWLIPVISQLFITIIDPNKHNFMLLFIIAPIPIVGYLVFMDGDYNY